MYYSQNLLSDHVNDDPFSKTLPLPSSIGDHLQDADVLSSPASCHPTGAVRLSLVKSVPTHPVNGHRPSVGASLGTTYMEENELIHYETVCEKVTTTMTEAPYCSRTYRGKLPYSRHWVASFSDDPARCLFPHLPGNHLHTSRPGTERLITSDHLNSGCFCLFPVGRTPLQALKVQHEGRWKDAMEADCAAITALPAIAYGSRLATCSLPSAF